MSVAPMAMDTEWRACPGTISVEPMAMKIKAEIHADLGPNSTARLLVA